MAADLDPARAQPPRLGGGGSGPGPRRARRRRRLMQPRPRLLLPAAAPPRGPLPHPRSGAPGRAPTSRSSPDRRWWPRIRPPSGVSGRIRRRCGHGRRAPAPYGGGGCGGPGSLAAALRPLPPDTDGRGNPGSGADALGPRLSARRRETATERRGMGPIVAVAAAPACPVGALSTRRPSHGPRKSTGAPHAFCRRWPLTHPRPPYQFVAAATAQNGMRHKGGREQLARRRYEYLEGEAQEQTINDGVRAQNSNIKLR